MGDIVEQVGELTKTAEIENLLMGIAYWLVVIIIILFVFLVAIKISNFVKKQRGPLRREMDDFFQ